MAEKSNYIDEKRILIVDDHPLICSGLVRIINDEKDLLVCGVANDIDTAMSQIIDRRPHAVILDLSLKDASGIDLIKAIRMLYPDLPSLVYSMHDECVFAMRTLREGAKGYVMKDQAPEVILFALRAVLNGNLYFSDTVAARLIDKAAVVSGKF